MPILLVLEDSFDRLDRSIRFSTIAPPVSRMNA